MNHGHLSFMVFLREENKMKCIRLANVADVPHILEIYAPYVKHSVVTFEYEVPSCKEFEKRMLEIQAAYPFLVCVIDGTIAGYAYAHRHMERAAYHWNVELSVYVSSDYKRKSIGKALYTALLDILKLQNVRNAYSCITIPNPASLALHTTFGFQEIGIFHKTGYKLNKWQDIIWLGKVLYDENKKPDPIRSIHALNGDCITEIFHHAVSKIR